MSKKWFAVMLSAVLVLAASLPAAAEKRQTYTSGDYKYVLLDDGSAEITKYSGEDSALALPAQLDGYKVTSIGAEAFFYRTGLQSIAIPAGITNIGDGAFGACKGLRNITIPDSVTTVGYNPFRLCENLTKIVVSPDHPALAVIDGVLFSKPDKKLVCYPCSFTAASYTIPSGIAVIGEQAFIRCGELRNITIPDSVTAIEKSAFYWCSGLQDIAIPDRVSFIGEGAFYLCTGLQHVTIPAAVTSIEQYTFYGCTELTSMIIPDKVTALGISAFDSCSNLKSISIPGSVKSIEYQAFHECPDLTVTAPRDSYTIQYCKKYNIVYTYPDANDWLNN